MDQMTTRAGREAVEALGLGRALVGSHRRMKTRPGRLALLREQLSLAAVPLSSSIQKKVWICVRYILQGPIIYHPLFFFMKNRFFSSVKKHIRAWLDGSRTKSHLCFPQWNGRSHGFFSLRRLGKVPTERSARKKHRAEAWTADIPTLPGGARKPGEWNPLDSNDS